MLTKQSEVSFSYNSTPATQIIANTEVYDLVKANENLHIGFCFFFFAKACLTKSTKNQTSDFLEIY